MSECAVGCLPSSILKISLSLTFHPAQSPTRVQTTSEQYALRRAHVRAHTHKPKHAHLIQQSIHRAHTRTGTQGVCEVHCWNGATPPNIVVCKLQMDDVRMQLGWWWSRNELEAYSYFPTVPSLDNKCSEARAKGLVTEWGRSGEVRGPARSE